MEKKQTHMKHSRFRLLPFTLILGVLLLPSISAAGASPCVVYAYTESDNHYFLVQDNSTNFGNELKIVSNCENISLYIDDQWAASSSNGNFQYTLNHTLQNITLEAEGFQETYSNVVFYPDRLEWEGQWINLNNLDVQFIDAAKAEIQENWAAFLSVIIAWILSTYVYWNLISAYIQRNFIEEVIS